MRLLLFLSALLTGFTGAVSGARGTDVLAVERSVAQAMETLAEAATEVSQVARYSVSFSSSPAVSENNAKPAWELSDSPAPGARAVNEKRLF